MIGLIGWIIFLSMFWHLAKKSIKIFEHYLKKRVNAQTDNELFRYMLDRQWESWAKIKGIKVRKESQKTFFKSNKKSQDKGMGK